MEAQVGIEPTHKGFASICNVMIKCFYCSKETKNYKFCSRSCAASFNNKLKPRILKQIRYCTVCNTEIITRGKYCLKCKEENKERFKDNRVGRKHNNKDYVIQYRKNKKLEAIAYKGGCCELCGYNKCTAALDFHHLDPTQKEFSISAKNRKYNTESLRKELNKCMLVCRNCHAEIHFKN